MNESEDEQVTLIMDRIETKPADKVFKMQEAINNISFSQKEETKPMDSSAWFSPYPLPEPAMVRQAEKPKTPHITSPEVHSTSYYGDLINLEINILKAKEAWDSERPESYKVEMQA